MQRRMATALMVPLTPTGSIAKRTGTGALMSREAASFIKPNDRLSSLERLEIYSRSYWFRVVDSFTDDFPGLRAVLGAKTFDRMAIQYLRDRPSHSFTLRDLGSGLEAWLREHPGFAGTRHRMALDMAQLEWAHIVAFDGLREKVPGPEDLADLTPALRFGVQPYISLLDLYYPVDELRIKVNAGDDHLSSGAASNFARQKKHRAPRTAPQLTAEPIFLAVHRLDLNVYYRRLGREEFRLLLALRRGKAIAVAIREAFRDSSVAAEDIPPLLREWFAMWTEFGWLSVRSPGKAGAHKLL